MKGAEQRLSSFLLANSLELVNKQCDIRRKQTGCNGQKNDTEELADEINTPLTQLLLNLIGRFQHNVYPQHIQHQGYHNIEWSILCTK